LAVSMATAAILKKINPLISFIKHRSNIHRSVWKLLACWYNSKWHFHGNRGTKIMGWGDVRYCFAILNFTTNSFMLVIPAFLSSWMLSGIFSQRRM
jgi:hypothetical protein